MRKSIARLFFGNLVSKFIGLGREVLIAALFGTGQTAAALRVAQTGTLVPVNFFTSDALNSAFIPQYRQFRGESRDKAQTFFWALLALFGMLATLIGLALWVGAIPWVGAMAPGLEAGTSSVAVMMLRIMALGVPFYLLSALLNFLGMANEDFLPMAVRPVVQNLGMIAGALLAAILHDVAFLAWGFTVSYVIFGGWAAWRALRAGFLSLPARWEWPLAGAVTHAFWRTLRPLLLLPVMLQGNIVVERAVASVIGLATVAALDYARFVTETLVLLISVPIAFAGLAHWSGLASEVLHQRLRKVVMLMLVATVPASAFLCAHAHAIVEAAYARGAFDEASVRVTGDILFGIALGLWAQVIGYVLVKALNAQLRNRAVMWVMAAALLANVAFNLTMHRHLGAMTLGLGNTVYGLVLLGGTVAALGLWADVSRGGWVMGAGAAGYLLLDNRLPLPQDVWMRLALAVGFAVIYWTIWIAAVPLLRRAVLDAIAPKWRRTV